MKVINIQGLTQTKAKEVEELVSDDSIVCLTETQKKLRDINFSDNCVIVDNMREEQDRKGGGLMVLYRKDTGVDLEKIPTKCPDILHTKGKMRGWEMRLVVVYLSVNDPPRNNNIKLQMERIINGNSHPLLVMGDFNGHVGFKGEQKVNTNGEIILELIMLNDDCKCTGGEFTWSRNEQRSVIDYVLATNQVYRKFKSMHIDEEKDIFDMSDHNPIEVELIIKEKKKKCERKEWVVKEYYKTDNNSLERFWVCMESQALNKEVENIEKLESLIKRRC